MGAGLAVHPTAIDDQTSYKPNPLGVIRVENNIGNFQPYFEHISSVPRSGEDGGLNMFGINYLFEIK